MTATDNKLIEELGVSIKEYLDVRFDALEASFDDQVEAQEKALGLAKDEVDRRLLAMNGFREQMQIQATTFICRAEHTEVIEKIEADVRFLRESKATLDGKADLKQVYVVWVFSGVGILLGLAGLLVRFIH